MPYNSFINTGGSMNEEQQLIMVENQLDHIYALCDTYVESGEEEDFQNVRALYEEYSDWITAEHTEGDNEYIVAWAPNMLDCAN
tara:strand:- start:1005 stop:1256 length:252 start_codon:yes stop_codon:yes gene_type:complete